jgi:ATP-dependent DNA ligase
MGDKKNWLKLLAYITGSINQELLLRNEYLAAENKILKSQIKGRLRLSDAQRATLAEIANRFGAESSRGNCLHRQAGFHPGLVRKLVAQKFDGSKNREWPIAREWIRQ